MIEGTRQREAFDRYWRLGARRSIERLRDVLERDGDAPSIRTLYSWSSEFGWQQRIEELEREARAADREGYLEERREALRRHRSEGVLLQQKGVEWLSKLPTNRVSAAAAIRAIDLGIRIESDAHGLGREEPSLAGEVVEVHLHLGGDQDLFMFPDPDQDPAEGGR